MKPKNRTAYFTDFLLGLMLILLLAAGNSAEAVQPANPITTIITVSGTETWDRDIIFDGSGGLHVTGNLTIRGARITTTPDHRGDDTNFAIKVLDGGTLTISDGSVFDFSNLQCGISFFVVPLSIRDGSKLILDNAELSGANVSERPQAPLIQILGNSEVILRNNSKLLNNTRNISEWYGRIILVEKSKLTIENAVFEGNTIGAGSIIYADQSTIAISGKNVFRGNTAEKGGLIHADRSTVEISGSSTFQNNTAKESGGVINALDSEINISGENLFSGNSASDQGGAIYVSGGTLNVSGGTFENNTVTGKGQMVPGGGAISGLNTEITVNNALFNENNANFNGNWYAVGGAVFINDGKLTVRECTFTDNNQKALETILIPPSENPRTMGGAIGILLSELFIDENNRFVNNIAEAGGAVFSGHESVVEVSTGNVFENNRSAFNGGAMSLNTPVKVRIGDNNLFKNNSADLGVSDTGYPNTGGAVAIGFFPLPIEEADVVIGASEFTGNSAARGGAIDFWMPGSLTLNNTVFRENKAGSDNKERFHFNGGAVCSSGKLIVNDAVFADNAADRIGGAIYKTQDELIISGSEFSGNTADSEAGSLYLEECSLEITGSVIKNSTAGRYGGAVEAYSTDITISDSGFENNETRELGGAIASFDGSLQLDGVTFENNRVRGSGRWGAGGAVWIQNMNVSDALKVVIQNSAFRENSAGFQGGAISLGFREVLPPEGGTIEAEITSTEFTGNRVTGADPDERDGGAVFIDKHAKVYMKDLAVTENIGGSTAILSGAGARLLIHPRRGASVFSNGGSDIQGVLYDGLSEEDLIRNISGIMSNGGLHRWVTSVEDHAISGESGRSLLFYAEPTYTDIPEISTLMRNNQVLSGDEPAAGQLHASAILNDGYLEIGEEGISIPVEVVWEDDEPILDLRPAPEEYVRQLLILAGSEPYNRGGASLIDHTADETGADQYLFRLVDDPAAFIRLADNHNGSYSLRIDSLPAALNGVAAAYDVSQSPLPYYETEVRGSMSEGFTITNRWNGELPPTPTPEPTATPEPGPGRNWFRLLEDLEALPATGFSAGSVIAKAPKVDHAPTGLTLEIPSLSVSAEIVNVPFADGGFPVERIGSHAGMLEGSAAPGEGITILTGHNHLDNAQSGPFAMLRYLKEGDRIFVTDPRGGMRSFTVYANEKISETDIPALERLASTHENTLTLLTCEDERSEGGYANRRVICAKPD